MTEIGERLCDPAQMGERYKVLSIVDTRHRENEPPAGFVVAEKVTSPDMPPIYYHQQEVEEEPIVPPIAPPRAADFQRTLRFAEFDNPKK